MDKKRAMGVGAKPQQSIVVILWKSLRPNQWVKNVVVFFPTVFSGQLVHPETTLRASLSALCFCLASSAVYLLNDVLDRRVDRFHPTKRMRPIASGVLPVPLAIVASGVLVLIAVVMGYGLSPRLGQVLLGYLGLVLSYSMWLKRAVILDVVVLALGFVLRVWGGSVVLGIEPSHWLQLSMFFLALFLGLAKRRQELLTLHANALRHRRVLVDYTLAFIDQLTAILTAVTLLCYALYTVSPEVTKRVGPSGFIYTVPFVIYAVFRYLYLVHVKHRALDPTDALWSDPPLQIALLIWVIAVLVIIYQ